MGILRTWPRRARFENRVSGVLDAEVDMLAEELEVLVPQHRPRQQAELEEHLEPVADAQDEPAPAGELPDLPHERRELGDGPGPQVVAVGKTSGEDDAVHAPEVVVLVPEEDRRLAEDLLQGVISVMVAVRTGKDDDSELQGLSPSSRP